MRNVSLDYRRCHHWASPFTPFRHYLPWPRCTYVLEISLLITQWTSPAALIVCIIYWYCVRIAKYRSHCWLDGSSTCTKYQAKVQIPSFIAQYQSISLNLNHCGMGSRIVDNIGEFHEDNIILDECALALQMKMLNIKIASEGVTNDQWIAV